ncbi:MAG: HD-GYP domain-containing protein, partial [Candidatus Omnitrophica bacterium]|nr:HD-GYP domain-containing protein [Candidatus Omnitrophota bacterium]
FRLKVEGDDEFGKLARTFNKMADSLNASRKILRGYLYRTVRSMVSILEARDPYTRGHSERVASFSEKIARKMGLSEKKIALLKETALLHDIGKLGIEENILNKIEPPTDQEWDIIKKHPSIGAEVLRPIFFEKDAIDIVIQHHERFDGKGYPYGLSGNEINILAQILSVADAFDAMTSARAYKEPMSKSEAARELKEKSGTQFNPDIVNAFLQILEDEMHHVLG